MSRRPDRPALGALFIVIASACFAGTGLFTQLAAPHAGEFVVIFSGFAVSAVVIIPIALLRGVRFLVSAHTGLLVVRSLVGIVQIGFLFIAFRTISLVDGMLLRDAAPLWVPVLLLLFWRERMPSRLWIAIIIGFIGMVLVLHPGITGSAVGYLFGLVAGLLFGLQTILSRKIDEAGEPVLRTVCYINGAGLILLSVPAALQWAPMPAETWMYLIIGGSLLLGSTTFLLIGFQFAPAYLLAPFSYSAVVFSAVLDWLVFEKIPNLITVAGIILVVSAGLLILRLQHPRDGVADTAG